MRNSAFSLQRGFRVGVRSISCLVILTIACSGDTPPTSPDDGDVKHGAIVSIALSPATPELVSLGEALLLTALATDADGRQVATADFEWSSSDSSIVAVAASSHMPGVANATALANGEAMVIAKASGVSGAATVTVEQKVARILTSSLDAVEFPGDSARVSAVAADARGNAIPTAAINWTSLSPIVASVDSTGLIIAQTFGTATITAAAGSVKKSLLFEIVGNKFFLNDEVRLRYDLDLPDSSGGPFPAIVFVHGSGRLDRKMVAHGTNPLVALGVAVLRYDKRGVGESTGTFFNIGPRNSKTGLGILASDVGAAVRFLKNFLEIDPQRIGVLGNSQGGWIGPLAAAEADEISFLLMWSGPTVSVGLEIFYSNLADGTATPLDVVYRQLSNFNGLAGYMPLPTLAGLDIPSLWLYGGLDRSIPTRVDTSNMRQLQSLGKPYEFIMYPFARHDLRDTRSGEFVSLWVDYAAWLRAHGFL